VQRGNGDDVNEFTVKNFSKISSGIHYTNVGERLTERQDVTIVQCLPHCSQLYEDACHAIPRRNDNLS
jgi:hypothetical protein